MFEKYIEWSKNDYIWEGYFNLRFILFPIFNEKAYISDRGWYIYHSNHISYIKMLKLDIARGEKVGKMFVKIGIIISFFISLQVIYVMNLVLCAPYGSKVM